MQITEWRLISILYSINRRMRDQSLLVAFVAAAAVLVVTHAATVQPTDTTKDNEINVDERFKPDPKIPKALDPRFNKMIMPKQPLDVLVDSTTAAAAAKTKKPPTTKVETSTIGELLAWKDRKTFISFIAVFCFSLSYFLRNHYWHIAK